MQQWRFTTIYSSWNSTIRLASCHGKNYHSPLKYAKSWRHREICPRQKEPFWQIKHLVMKAATLELRLYPCACNTSCIMSYQPAPLWPDALCHLISSTRASCHCINKSLSRLDAIEIFILGRLKGDLQYEGGGKKKGKKGALSVHWLGLIF